jgi:hypothetical protein
MYKHAIARPGLRGGTKTAVEIWRSVSSRKASERFAALGADAAFVKDLYRRYHWLLVKHRFRPARIAEFFNRSGVKTRDGQSWSSREVSWLLARTKSMPAPGRGVLRTR